MPNLIFSSSFEVRESLAIETHELKSRFLFGVSLKDPLGQEIPDSVIESAIIESQSQLEHLLSLKLTAQVVTESKSQFYDDWNTYGFIKTTWPVKCPVSLIGKLGNIAHIVYPKEWLSVRSSSDDSTLSRNFYIMPFGHLSYRDTSTLTATQQANWWRSNALIPNYWDLTYVSGFRELPGDIKSALGKLSAIKVLTLGGQLTTTGGIRPGVASTSISLDGLSQSLSPLANNQSGPYGSLIKQYSTELEGDLKNLRDYYTQIPFTVC